MLDLQDPLHTTASFDPMAVDQRSDAELDALPFGVIAVDGDGTILRYNLYESRFARLDRNQVVGRNFFSEIAPCTRTPAFEGKFRTFVAQGEGPTAPRSDRFDYLFDFKFGAQEVSVDLVRVVGMGRYYLLVNRRKLLPPRPSIPKPQLAAAQSDLAPEETKEGVLRDELERRFVEAPAPFFSALRATCDRLAPESWQLFATEWGVQWGRRAAVDLEAAALEREAMSLRELPMREAGALVSAHLSDRGWGSLTFDLSFAAEGLLAVDIARSALAEAAPRPRLTEEPRPDLACHLVAGYVGAILSSIAGRRLAAREISCVAGGAERCTVVIVGHDRSALLDAALGVGVRGLEPVRAALARASSSVR